MNEHVPRMFIAEQIMNALQTREIFQDPFEVSGRLFDLLRQNPNEPILS
jgi:hypothetical protein